MEYFPQQFVRRRLQIKFFLHHKKGRNINAYIFIFTGQRKQL